MSRWDSSQEIRNAARELRKAGNSAEDRLWHVLRNRRFLGLKFRRQHPLGPFIADLYCAEHRLAIEVDGGVHDSADAQAHDTNRDAWLTERGITVIRIRAVQVLNDPHWVLRAIADVVLSPMSYCPLSRARERVSRATRGWGEGAPPGPGADLL